MQNWTWLRRLARSAPPSTSVQVGLASQQLFCVVQGLAEASLNCFFAFQNKPRSPEEPAASQLLLLWLCTTHRQPCLRAAGDDNA